MKITYFVHDLNDPAVHRRLAMLRAGGARVALVGFSRALQPITEIAGLVPVDLGRTKDARLIHRAFAVARALLKGRKTRDAIAGADVVIARQLEMLLVAEIARSRFAPTARLVYECLDIHRITLSKRMPGMVLRALERFLLRRCSLLLVSSPDFVTRYFAKAHAELPTVRVEENRVLEWEIGEQSKLGSTRCHTRPPGPPWRIGWFGVIRCSRSLRILTALAREFPGQIEVIIRGRPARNVLADFDSIVANTPGLSFRGPYDRGKDLAVIYHDVHFAWTIDFYEAGGNSDWLLPNRLYESCVMGAVPLASSAVQTGRWLLEHGIDLPLDAPLETSVPAFFTLLNQAKYEKAKAQIDILPINALVASRADCASLVESLSLARP